MNILQVTASLAPGDGGPATAITNINQQLRVQGSNSLIITTDADGPTGRLTVSHGQPIGQGDAATLFCRRSRPHSFKNSWSMAWRLIRIAPSSDMMHVHGIYLANSLYAWLAFKVTRTPYVIQPHGTMEPYQQRFRSWRKDLFNKLIGHRILRDSYALIAASEAEAQNISEQYPDLRVEVVTLGAADIHPKRPTHGQTQLQRWLKSPIEKRVIFLGRLAAKKRPDLLARAWFDMPLDAQLLFVGPSQDWTEDRLRRYVSETVQQSVHFIGEATPQEARWCLLNAGIFVLPSQNENFGIAVAEAMFAECAIVTTLDTAASEHVKAAGAGIILLDPKTSDLHDSILYLMSDGGGLKAKQLNARSYASRHLTWQSTAQSLTVIYRQAVSSINQSSNTDTPRRLNGIQSHD